MNKMIKLMCKRIKLMCGWKKLTWAKLMCRKINLVGRYGIHVCKMTELMYKITKLIHRITQLIFRMDENDIENGI